MTTQVARSLTLATGTLAAVFVLLEAHHVQAQQSRGTTGLSQQGLQGGFGTIGQGTSGIGQSTIGQSAFGQTGIGGAQTGIGGQRFGGQVGGNLNQQQVGGQDGFVGSDADQVRNQFSSQRQQRRAMFDFAIESLNEMRESRRQREQNNRTSPVRVKVRPAFSVRPTAAPVLANRVRENLNRAMPDGIAATRVSVNGSTAILEGSVAGDYERKLAAKMVSLTPGIYNVENRLTTQATSELVIPATE